MRVLATWGVVALLCSGVPWNYAWNFKWYGSISGPPAMRGLLLSGDQSIPFVWTRCCRGAVLFGFDVMWLPQSARETYEAVCQKAVGFLGGKKELAEDVNGFSHFEVGSGFGLIGLLVILPAFIYGAVRILRCRSKTSLEDKFPGSRDFLLLLLFVTGYALLCHVFLKSQDIGLWRVMPAFPVLAAPVCGLLLEKRWQRIAVLTLVGLCALVPASHNLVMMGNRFAADKLVSELENKGIVQKFFSKVGKRPPLEVECQWGDEAPQKALLHEPYNIREIALMFLQRAKHPAVIAFAGSFLSDAYYFFGPDLSNHVASLVDSRKPDQLLEPPPNADYLVFERSFTIDPVKQNVWARQHGYTPFLRVDGAHKCLLLAFQKNPNPEPRN